LGSRLPSSWDGSLRPVLSGRFPRCFHTFTSEKRNRDPRG
jgi:hypothetical protein